MVPTTQEHQVAEIGGTDLRRVPKVVRVAPPRWSIAAGEPAPAVAHHERAPLCGRDHSRAPTEIEHHLHEGVGIAPPARAVAVGVGCAERGERFQGRLTAVEVELPVDPDGAEQRLGQVEMPALVDGERNFARGRVAPTVVRSRRRRRASSAPRR